MKTEAIMIRVSPELKALIRKKAEDDQRSMASLVVKILEKEIKK